MEEIRRDTGRKETSANKDMEAETNLCRYCLLLFKNLNIGKNCPVKIAGMVKGETGR